MLTADEAAELCPWHDETTRRRSPMNCRITWNVWDVLEVSKNERTGFERHSNAEWQKPSTWRSDSFIYVNEWHSGKSWRNWKRGGEYLWQEYWRGDEKEEGEERRGLMMLWERVVCEGSEIGEEGLECW